MLVFVSIDYEERKFSSKVKNYIGASNPTEDPPGDVNSEGQSIGSFESSVTKRTPTRDVATRRDPIPFGTGDERKDPKSICW